MKVVVAEYFSRSKVLIALDDSEDEVKWLNEWIKWNFELTPPLFKVTPMKAVANTWIPDGGGAMVYHVVKGECSANRRMVKR